MVIMALVIGEVTEGNTVVMVEMIWMRVAEVMALVLVVVESVMTMVVAIVVPPWCGGEDDGGDKGDGDGDDNGKNGNGVMVVELLLGYW